MQVFHELSLQKPPTEESRRGPVSPPGWAEVLLPKRRPLCPGIPVWVLVPQRPPLAWCLEAVLSSKQATTSPLLNLSGVLPTATPDASSPMHPTSEHLVLKYFLFRRIIIMDLQMVDDDYIYNTIQLTLQEKTTFDQSTNLKGLLPNTKSPRRRHKSLFYQSISKFSIFFDGVCSNTGFRINVENHGKHEFY